MWLPHYNYIYSLCIQLTIPSQFNNNRIEWVVYLFITLITNIDLSDWKDYETIILAMKVFPTMYKTDVNDIKDTFDSFIAILKERKEEALKQAQSGWDPHQ